MCFHWQTKALEGLKAKMDGANREQVAYEMRLFRIRRHLNRLGEKEFCRKESIHYPMTHGFYAGSRLWYAIALGHLHEIKKALPFEFSSVTTNALKELYEVGSLCESDQKLYYLIQRYYRQVRSELRQKAAELRCEGKKEFGRILSDMVSRPNPFLELVKKELGADPFGGKYLPVPVAIGGEP